MTVTKSLFFDCCSSVLGWVFAGWHTERKIYCEDSREPIFKYASGNIKL